jgi:hypothetical protein
MLAILASAALGSVAAWAQSHTEPAQVSEPASQVVTSNLSDNLNPGLERLNPSASGFKQVQEDLFRPLANSIRSVDSMQGILELPTPQPRPQLSRHARELMDQRKNWAFADFKDLYPEPSAEEMLGVKESDGLGGDKVSVSVIEKYYENLGQKPSQNQNNLGEGIDLTGTRQYSTSNNLQLLTRSFQGSDQFTKILFSGGPEAFVSEKNPQELDESQALLGDANELRASQKRLADFRQMLDPNQQIAGAPGGLISTSPEEVARRAGITEPYRSSISPMLGVIDPTKSALHTRSDDDPTASRLGMPNPPKWTPPPKPPETMQQMLDPFAAGMSRPKY